MLAGCSFSSLFAAEPQTHIRSPPLRKRFVLSQLTGAHLELASLASLAADIIRRRRQAPRPVPRRSCAGPPTAALPSIRWRDFMKMKKRRRLGFRRTTTTRRKWPGCRSGVVVGRLWPVGCVLCYFVCECVRAVFVLLLIGMFLVCTKHASSSSSSSHVFSSQMFNEDAVAAFGATQNKSTAATASIGRVHLADSF